MIGPLDQLVAEAEARRFREERDQARLLVATEHDRLAGHACRARRYARSKSLGRRRQAAGACDVCRLIAQWASEAKG